MVVYHNKSKTIFINKEVLKKLEHSKIYRTDQDGSIIFKIKKNKLSIKKLIINNYKKKEYISQLKIYISCIDNIN